MIGRPLRDEVAPYYFTYIDLVKGGDPGAAVEAQLESSLEFFSAISEDQSLHKYEPAKWSMRQVLNHVNDTERAFVFRALWFARGFTAPLPSFDQNISVAGAESDRVPWASHVDEFRLVRLATISFFRNMPVAAWMRSGIASGNPFTVRSLGFIIAGHLEHHKQILRERYL